MSALQVSAFHGIELYKSMGIGNFFPFQLQPLLQRSSVRRQNRIDGSGTASRTVVFEVDHDLHSNAVGPIFSATDGGCPGVRRFRTGGSLAEQRPNID